MRRAFVLLLLLASPAALATPQPLTPSPASCDAAAAPPPSSASNNALIFRNSLILLAMAAADVALVKEITTAYPDNTALAVVLGQVSGFGMVLAAPILEPLQAGIRRLAFRIRGAGPDTPGAAEGAPSPEDPRLQELNTQWRRTNEHYSLNEQMARNVLHQAMTLTRTYVEPLYRARNEGDIDRAALLAAELALALRANFMDVPAEDPVLVLAIRNSVPADEGFGARVLAQVEALAPEAWARDRDAIERMVRAWTAPTGARYISKPCNDF